MKKYFGLTDIEVEEQRKKYGSNKLPEPEKKHWTYFAKEALSDRITMILIAIACVQLVLGVFGVLDLLDPIMILVVLCIVTGIGVKTGMSVQTSSEILRKVSAQRTCQIYRDGKIHRLDKNEIVVGDLVCLELGQEIYADGYLVDGEISVSNAAINGETKEIHKHPIENYQPKEEVTTQDYINENCLFAGTTVMEGTGVMKVTKVGIHTVNGDTLVKMQTLEAPKTALDLALDQLANMISKWGSIAAILAFILMLVFELSATGISDYFGQDKVLLLKDFMDKFCVALTIIVAAVPEGLPLIVKLIMQQNVTTMFQAHTLAKNPNKIPEMAYLNLVCTDKTGTLTTGVMTPEIMRGEDFAENLILNSAATLDQNGEITGGNSIDRALLMVANGLETEQKTKVRKIKVVKTQAFHSQQKYSAVSATHPDGRMISYYKGAPERILARCTKYMDHGKVKELTDAVRERLEDGIQSANEKSIRCVALAKKDGMLQKDVLPEGLTYQGYIGVRDPLRDEVKEAVAHAKEAGIQVIEMTGDALSTAIAIAKDAGIYHEGDLALTDQEFMEKTDEEIKTLLPNLRVIARCAPSTKLRLVTLAQEMGLSVAMTGDGTNDSPALKKADVGFAMEVGTDVAKEAGDVILTDNNFASIIKGILLGRTFMHNIHMFLEFQLPINISLLVLNLLYPFLGTEVFLTSVLILVINIIMDSLNSLSFGSEPPKDVYMKEAPLKKGSGLFDQKSIQRIVTATISFLCIYGIFFFSQVAEVFPLGKEALTARFVLICFMSVMNGFCVRVEGCDLWKGMMKNKRFPIISLGILVGTIILCECLGPIFHVTSLSLMQWGILLGLSCLVIPISLLARLIFKEKD